MIYPKYEKSQEMWFVVLEMPEFADTLMQLIYMMGWRSLAEKKHRLHSPCSWTKYNTQMRKLILCPMIWQPSSCILCQPPSWAIMLTFPCYPHFLLHTHLKYKYILCLIDLTPKCQLSHKLRRVMNLNVVIFWYCL